MKGLFTLIVISLVPLFGFSQCYEIQPRPYYPDPYLGGTQHQLNDDSHTGIVELGFPFCFFGDSVTHCVIASNGYITFDTTAAYGGSQWSINSAIPNPALTTKFTILAPWQDLSPPLGGTISSSTYGVPPYRRFIVSYDSVSMFGCSDSLYSCQIVVYESLNVIDVNILNKPLCSTWNSGAGIEGIHNQDGSIGIAIPGRNFPSQWSAQYDSHRFVPICDCPTDSLPDLGLVPGKVFWDENSNCEQDLNEVLVPNVRLDIQPGNGITWTNQNGEFAVMMEPGNYTFEHSSLNPWYLINECQNGALPVTVVADSNALDVCFGDSIVPVIDLGSTISTGAINACFGNSQHITVCNYGTIPALDVLVEAQIPSFTGTSNPDFTMVNDSIWSITIPSLAAGQCLNYLFTGTADCDSSLIGQVACLSVSISNSEVDVDTTNNEMSFCDSVGVSYDPNDIRVLSLSQEQGWRTQEFIDDDDVMTYMVRFQNTGTGPAYNVIVRNPLSQYLNNQSIEIIASSHSNYAQMTNGELSVHFLGIELPDSASDPLGSQGYFIYKIRQPLGNPLGTLIENQAEIYFDFNAPVATNITENEILLLTGIDSVEMGEINLYPNPTTGEIFLSNSSPRNSIHSVDVIDTQGRLLLKEIGSSISKIDLGQLSKGIYLLRIQTEKGIQVERVVRN